MDNQRTENSTDEWLALSEAAELLGMHPSTVRTWTDKGVLPYYRTSGGHRRYKRSELELWSQSKRGETPLAPIDLMKAAVRHIRVHIAEGDLENEVWYQKLDDNARIQYRSSGATLAHGLLNYLTSDSEGASSEARSIGYEYASRAQSSQLSDVEASCALLFFRNKLIETIVRQIADSKVSAEDAWHLLSRVIAFTDQIQLSLLDTFHSFEQAHESTLEK